MKRTVKYLAAVEAAAGLKIRGAADMENEALYARLAEAGLVWDSRTGQWVTAPSADAAPDGKPGLVRVRFTANADELGDVVDWFVRGANSAGARVLDVSEPYLNLRKGTGCRVYVTLDMEGCFG